jgi:transposase
MLEPTRYYRLFEKARKFSAGLSAGARNRRVTIIHENPTCGAHGRELADEQWILIAPLLADHSQELSRRGRPWRDNREVLEGVFWVLRHSARWRDLPESFPSATTCYRRYRRWLEDGTLRRVLETLADDLRETGGLDITTCRVDDLSLSDTNALDQLNPTEADISWQTRTAALLVSPATIRLLRRLHSPLAKRLS